MIRRDLFGMIFEAQLRNESARQVFGESYKSFCDGFLISTALIMAGAMVIYWYSLFRINALIGIAGFAAAYLLPSFDFYNSSV